MYENKDFRWKSILLAYSIQFDFEFLSSVIRLKYHLQGHIAFRRVISKET